MIVRPNLALLLLALPLFAGCNDDPEPTLAQGIFAPLGDPLPSASATALEAFERGRAVSMRRFTSTDGLGPRFNVTSCGACHEKPTMGGGAARYRNFLLVGERLEDGSFVSTGTNGIQAHYTLDERNRFPDEASANNLALRNPIPFFGVGLLAEIPEGEILKRSDPNDKDGDGISGRPNFDRGFVGRFGRKAQTVSIEGFIRGPLFNHAGITTNPLSDDLRAMLPIPPPSDSNIGISGGALRASDVDYVTATQAAAPDEPTLDEDDVPDPELGGSDLFDLVAFTMLLAAPAPSEPTPESLRGEKLFESLACTSCHVPSLEGPRGLIPAYTDLLLHDMGDAMADGVDMNLATGSEFRTQPLWGVAAVGPYLHDGRADTLTEAILAHGGEGQGARDAFEGLDEDAQDDVLAFLRSLGGESQRSDGLLSPDEAIPVAGQYGAARGELAEDDRARFLRGRRIFDRDEALSAGLGPLFNGDSCRACHFDPTIGGSGPSDVDVTRQGFGTATRRLHRGSPVGHDGPSTLRVPPPPSPLDPDSNFIELRQTPPLFGLGLVDTISDATIMAGADPDDQNGDGIRGRVHVLNDGRIGKFGWKADVPSLAEFARDALSTEMGVTVPVDQGFTFGKVEDSDDAPDPEIDVADFEDLVFFMANLAPPPRGSTNPDDEAQGEKLFAETGCVGCHTPTLPTEKGTDAALYSDLLLHSVSPAGTKGIVVGDAGPTDFRTPPLWGLATTAPYMHDGRSPTIEDAVLRHDGEANTSREAFSSLSKDQRAALLSFLQSL